MTNPPTTIKPVHRVGAALFAIALGALAACDNESTHPPTADIGADLTCVPEPSGQLSTKGTVTNHSSKTSTYFIDFELQVDGVSADTTSAVVSALPPGATVPVSATFPTGSISDDARCVVVRVERFKA